MSSIHQQHTYKFPQGDVTMYQEEREIGTHGSAVELTRYPHEGSPETIYHCSWNYAEDAEVEAKQVFDELHKVLSDLEGDDAALQAYLDNTRTEDFYDAEQDRLLVDEISVGLYQEDILRVLEKLGVRATLENCELSIEHEVGTKFSDRMFSVAQRELEAVVEALKEEGIFEETQESAPDFSHHAIYKILLPEVLSVAHDNMELSEEQFSEADAIALTNRLCEDRKSDAEEFNVYLTDIEEMQDDDDWSDVNGAIAAMIKKYLSEKGGN